LPYKLFDPENYLPKSKGFFAFLPSFLPSLPNQKKPTYFLSFLAQLFSFFEMQVYMV